MRGNDRLGREIPDRRNGEDIRGPVVVVVDPSFLLPGTEVVSRRTIQGCLPGERGNRRKGLRCPRIKYGAGSGVVGPHVFPHPGQGGTDGPVLWVLQ